MIVRRAWEVIEGSWQVLMEGTAAIQSARPENPKLYEGSRSKGDIDKKRAIIRQFIKHPQDTLLGCTPTASAEMRSRWHNLDKREGE